MKFTTAQ